MKIYAISDHHFFHQNIIKYAKRPFEFSQDGVVENINLMVNNHNSVVKDDDIVFFLGDLSHGRTQTKEALEMIIKNMNGKKVLIKGNHDNFSNYFYEELFDEVKEYFEYNGIFMSHYPCYESKWTSDIEKSHIEYIKDKEIKLIIHGHCHNKNPDDWETDGYKRLNVCVDYTPNNYTPVDITNIFKEVNNGNNMGR